MMEILCLILGMIVGLNLGLFLMFHFAGFVVSSFDMGTKEVPSYNINES